VKKDATLKAGTYRLPAWIHTELKALAIKIKVPVQDIVRQFITEGLAKR